ncbi:MAG: hypothetical protein IT168_27810 [Bryobacterales bacterium]|nr:hypothetical protein [Bryobacterales bacterium]
MSTNHSTGPRTEEGKAKSAQNARKHGLAAEAIPVELQPVFNDLRNELRSQCQPEGPLEEIFFDKLVTARWNMLRSLDLENELYELSEGKDPLCHPATVKQAELYSRYYIRYDGAFNRAYKQLKDCQTNRICQLIEADPEAPRPALILPDAIKIQRFAKRTAAAFASAAEPRSEQSGAQESEDILKYYSPDEAAEIREEAQTLGVSVNLLISSFAKHGYSVVYKNMFGDADQSAAETAR